MLGEKLVTPIETPRAQRAAEFKRRQLPIVVWSVAALVCVFMLVSRAVRFEHIEEAWPRSLDQKIEINLFCTGMACDDDAAQADETSWMTA